MSFFDHSTAKTNDGWWSAMYWFNISRQAHGNVEETVLMNYNIKL